MKTEERNHQSVCCHKTNNFATSPADFMRIYLLPGSWMRRTSSSLQTRVNWRSGIATPQDTHWSTKPLLVHTMTWHWLWVCWQGDRRLLVEGLIGGAY